MKENEVGGTCDTHGRGEKNMQNVLMGKPEGKRPLGRPKSKWEDGIRRDLGETGWYLYSGLCWLRIEIGGGLLWIQ
jgi:hypothetical protein